MQSVNCVECGQTFATNTTFLVFDEVLCEACANAKLSAYEGKKIPPGSVIRQIDPTICFKCGADGKLVLPLVGNWPACSKCEPKLRNWPYPSWIKVSLAAMMLLVIITLACKWRFVQGYYEMRQAFREAKVNNDITTAAKLAQAAVTHVPECEWFKIPAALYQGLVLLQEDKCAEALPLLRQYQRASPSDRGIQVVIIKAESGAAFDEKNYDVFLAKSKEIRANYYPRDSSAIAQVASALACKYAVTGKEDFRIESLNVLAEASALAPKNDLDFVDYQQRILHRLDTREIISSEEFHRRFPNGWKKG